MLIPDGIWLDLPHEAHVADPALGSGDLKQLLINPVFWHGSQRNPTWRRILADSKPLKKRESEAAGKRFGSCLHTAVIEPDQFDARYFVRPPRPDLPSTKEQMADALRAIGQTPPSMGRKAIEFEAACAAWGIELADSWDVRVAELADGRDVISETTRQSVELTARVVDRHSEARKFLSSGRAEVSMFWTDEHGDRYKARFDYLRIRTLADLKTFANAQGGDTIAVFNASREKFAYEVQAAYYMEARTTILPELVAKRKIWRGMPEPGEDGAVFARPPTADDLAFFDKVADFTDPSWWWVAVSTQGIPECDTIEFPTGLIAFSSAKVQADLARENYRVMRERFGQDDAEMWVADRGLLRLTEFNFTRRSLDRGAVLHESITS
jgi:hypothetical protein